jgi:ketosteroid isomerase-like protein
MLRLFVIGMFSMGYASAVADYPAQEHWSAEQRDVWAVILEWNDAFERNDVDAYFSWIEDAIVVLTPGSPYRVEYAAPDRREFEFAIKRGYGEIQFFQELEPRIDIFGDTAVATYYSRGLWGRDSTQMSYLKETNVLVKGAGGWKIVHVHVSR